MVEEAPETKTYTVWFYEVWGNDEEGYSVNDRSEAGTIELPTNHTEKEFIEAIGEYFDMEKCMISNDCDPEFSYQIVLQDDEFYPVGEVVPE